MTEYAIRAEGLTKQFRMDPTRHLGIKERLLRRKPTAQERVVTALRDASFDVRPGETFGLIGHNGAGKSTALKVIAGIYQPTAGSVAVHGRVAALLELGAGFHGDLTGRENIRLNGSILGLSRREIEAAIPAIIEFSELDRFIDVPVKSYSSGMYMRLGFAVAVNLDPDILIVDEVLGVGDEHFRNKCLDHFFQLRQKGTTILMVSHAMPLVEALCDRVAWLDHGEIRKLGPAREVTSAYLDAVNEEDRQAARRHLSTDPTGAQPGPGTEISLGALVVCDGAGEPVAEAISCEPLRIRLHYHAAHDLEGADFGLAIETEDGRLVFAPASPGELDPQPIPAGDGYAEWAVDSLLLEGGVYVVTTAIGFRGRMFDTRMRVQSLTVRPAGGDRGALFRHPGHWSIHSSNVSHPGDESPTAQRHPVSRA